MKENMNNKKWLLPLLLLCMTVILMIPVETQAASTKAKALKAYRKLLTQSRIKWNDYGTYVNSKDCFFAIAYVDNNSVPELILECYTTSHAEGYGALYTYRNGKAQLVTGLSLNGPFRYYKKKGIFIDNYTGSGVGQNYYTKLYKGKAYTKLGKAEEVQYWNNNKVSYTYTDCTDLSNYKQISKSTFKKRLKKLVGSSKVRTVSMKTNTKANRSRYLK